MATVKQKIAARKVLKGTSIRRAMREAGYSKTTAKTTGKLTRSKGWQELIDKFISEEALMKVHREGLSATQTRFTPEGEQIKITDFATRHKYLETGYKVRGRIKDNMPPQVLNVLNVYTTEQLQRIAARVFNGGSESATEPHRLPDSDESAV